MGSVGDCVVLGSWVDGETRIFPGVFTEIGEETGAGDF